MKSRTMMAMAVASAFGVSTAAFAGFGHHGSMSHPISVSESGPAIVVHETHGAMHTAGFMPNPATPSSPNESAPWAVADDMRAHAEHVASVESARLAASGQFDTFAGASDSFSHGAIGSTSASASGSLGGTFSAEGEQLSSESTTSFEHDLASSGFSGGDEYIVSWTPMLVEQWDLYRLDVDSQGGSDDYAMSDDLYLLTHRYDIVLIPGGGLGFADDDASLAMGDESYWMMDDGYASVEIDSYASSDSFVFGDSDELAGSFDDESMI